MFRYNPKANYQPKGGGGVDIFKFYQVKIFINKLYVVSAGSHGDTFPARFPNIFVDYPLGKCESGINCGQTGIKLLCDYGKLS